MNYLEFIAERKGPKNISEFFEENSILFTAFYCYYLFLYYFHFCTLISFLYIISIHRISFFLNRPLLPCGVEGFLLVNLLDNW
jgi:hypothetical protein